MEDNQQQPVEMGFQSDTTFIDNDQFSEMIELSVAIQSKVPRCFETEDEETFRDMYHELVKDIWLCLKKYVEAGNTALAAKTYNYVYNHYMKEYREKVMIRGIFDGFTFGKVVLKRMDIFVRGPFNFARHTIDKIKKLYPEHWDSFVEHLQYEERTPIDKLNPGVMKKLLLLDHMNIRDANAPAAAAAEQPLVPSEELGDLTTKQQVLLLHKLGIFDLPMFKSMSLVDLGKLFGVILDSNSKNVENFIRYRRDGKGTKYSLHTEDNEAKVAEILNSIKITIP